MPTPDQRYQEVINAHSEMFGFESPQFSEESQMTKKVPFLIVKAERDTVKKLNDTIQHFVSESKDIPITLINHDTG